MLGWKLDRVGKIGPWIQKNIEVSLEKSDYLKRLYMTGFDVDLFIVDNLIWCERTCWHIRSEYVKNPIL